MCVRVFPRGNVEQLTAAMVGGEVYNARGRVVCLTLRSMLITRGNRATL